jgi:transposase-like protein
MKLTPTQRDAILAEYDEGLLSVLALARKHNVSPVTVQNLRRRAGMPSRLKRGGSLSVQVVAEMSPLLPVFPVRLVSRPGGGS